MNLLDRIVSWCVPDRIAPTPSDELGLIIEEFYLVRSALDLGHKERAESLLAEVEASQPRVLISAKDAPIAVEQWQAWVGEAGNRYPPIWH